MTKKDVLIKVAIGEIPAGIAGTVGGGVLGTGIGALATLIRNAGEKNKEKRNENWRKGLAYGAGIGAGAGGATGVYLGRKGTKFLDAMVGKENLKNLRKGNFDKFNGYDTFLNKF
jgi:membrane protein YqaA with SNARE-associated domain